MGLACSKVPPTVEWTQNTVGWGPEQKSPAKAYPQDLQATADENLIKAHHNVHTGPAQNGASQETDCESQNEIEEKIKWSCGDCIGHGAFGKVYLGLNTETGNLMAVKQIKISNEQSMAVPVAQHVQKVEAEVYVLKELHHPNIVRYLGTERTEETLNIFLEYVPGGSIASLLSKFGQFNEGIIKIYTRQILLGLEYLHRHAIIHRDIKGANILLDNSGLVKLADFGASKKIETLATIDSQMKQSIKGTPHFMAPEVIHQKGVGRASDIWSVACTIIEMATGKPPWSHIKSQVSVMLHIAQANGPPPLPDHLSSSCRDFLRLCFAISPRDRPNASRLLQHPFLEGLASPGTIPPGPKITPLPSLKRMEVPSPIQEESSNGTPSSRGTGTTTSSSASSRRPGFANTEDIGTKFSPMGHGVRQSQMLMPVAEGSHEGSTEQQVGIDEMLRNMPLVDQLPRIEEPPTSNPLMLTSIDDFNPIVEPSWNQENAPWEVNITSPSNVVVKMPTTTMGLQILSPKSNAVTQLSIRQSSSSGCKEEASEQSIMMWVQDRGRGDALRRSQSFSNFNPCISPVSDFRETKPLTPTASDLKEAMWEAELERELEQQRQEQRRSRAIQNPQGFRSPIKR